MNGSGQNGVWLLFVRKGKVFIPTVARTEAGYYLGIEPIAVIDCQDRNAVSSGLVDAIKRGNPIIPTPSRANFPPDPIFECGYGLGICMLQQWWRTW
jgi:hypothetical protein